MQDWSCATQKSTVYAGAGIDSIQSFDDCFLSAAKGKRKEWEGYCLRGYAETGSRYLWSPEIRQKV